MKSWKNITVLLVLFGLLFSAGCTKQKTASEEVDLGTIEGTVYKNDFFGMTLAFPDDWHIPDEKTVAMIMNAGKKMISGGDKKLAKDIKSSEDRVLNLFFLFKEPVGAETNPNIIMVGEKLPNISLIKSGIDYHNQSRKLIKRSAMKVKFVGDIYSETIGGAVFDVSTSEMNLYGSIINQKSYVTIKKSYAVIITLTYFTEEQENQLEQILDSIHFN
jgi:hypothetical protein